MYPEVCEIGSEGMCGNGTCVLLDLNDFNDNYCQCSDEFTVGLHCDLQIRDLLPIPVVCLVLVIILTAGVTTAAMLRIRKREALSRETTMRIATGAADGVQTAALL